MLRLLSLLPQLFRYLGYTFVLYAPAIIKKILVALGIGIVTYQGADTVTTALQTAIQTRVTALPADVLSIMSMMGVVTGINMMLTTIVTATAIKWLFNAKQFKILA
jgi:hypothetical protein